MSEPTVSDEVLDAWLQAAEDLGIEVITPFRLDGFPDDAITALVVGFGSPRGPVLCRLSGRLDEVDGELPNQAGYYSSWLNPTAYRRYDRDRWSETLEDWGWQDTSRPAPIWYRPLAGPLQGNP